MFHHPIYNKRQKNGKDVGGPSKLNHELSSLSSTNTAANCKYTFHVQSFNLLWKQVITYSCTTSIYYDSYKLHLVGYFCCFCVLIIPALAALQDIFPEWDMTTLEGILQRCGGVVSDAVDMVFAEFPPMNVCSNVSSTATCEPGNYNLWYCNNL